MTDERNVVPLKSAAVTAPTNKRRRMIRKVPRGPLTPIKPVRDRLLFDQKVSSAYLELEPVILDLERAAKLAEKMFIEDPDEEELELGRFAVYQFRAMASDLVRLWNKRYHTARAEASRES